MDGLSSKTSGFTILGANILRTASEPVWSRAVDHRSVQKPFIGGVLDAVMANYLILGGTDGSDPLPSSGELGANLTLSGTPGSRQDRPFALWVTLAPHLKGAGIETLVPRPRN